LAAQQVEIAAECGERGAQFVRDIGDKWIVSNFRRYAIQPVAALFQRERPAAGSIANIE